MISGPGEAKAKAIGESLEVYVRKSGNRVKFKVLSEVMESIQSERDEASKTLQAGEPGNLLRYGEKRVRVGMAPLQGELLCSPADEGECASFVELILDDCRNCAKLQPTREALSAGDRKQQIEEEMQLVGMAHSMVRILDSRSTTPCCVDARAHLPEIVCLRWGMGLRVPDIGVRELEARKKFDDYEAANGILVNTRGR